LIVPSAAELQHRIVRQQRQLQLIWQRYLKHQALKLDNLRLKLHSPERILEMASQRVDEAVERINRALSNRLRFLRLELATQARHLLAVGPAAQLSTASATVRTLRSRLIFGVNQRLGHQQQKLSGLSRMLHSVSPLPTIGRGYGLVTDANGNVITSVAGLEPGNQTITYLQDGSVVAQIEEIQAGATPADRPKI